MSAEQRDQWGETAEERHARILARDLAWMTYAEACARDGVPRSERDHLIFNDGYAAGRADYLPAARVVAEEPEWEYGIALHGNPEDCYAKPRHLRSTTSQEWAQREATDSTTVMVRRRAPGPWEPAHSEEESNRPSVFIQYKGTDICLDFRCICFTDDEDGHFDGYFAHALQCGRCGRIYELPHTFEPKLVESSQHEPKVIHPCSEEQEGQRSERTASR